MSANNNMESEIKEIESISYWNDVIRRHSSNVFILKLKTAKIASTNLLETVHDPKSGPYWFLRHVKHVIKTNGDCPGHFGHIELNVCYNSFHFL